MKHHARVSEWNEAVCPSFAWEMKGCHFRCNALWFVREVECLGEGGWSSLFLLLRISHLRSLCWLTPILSAHVNGGGCVVEGCNLDSHRFLPCSASSGLLATQNAEKRSDLLLHSVLPAPSQDRIPLPGVTRADLRAALPALVSVRKSVSRSSEWSQKCFWAACEWMNEWQSTAERQKGKQWNSSNTHLDLQCCDGVRILIFIFLQSVRK